jgi:O-antigen ligase
MKLKIMPRPSLPRPASAMGPEPTRAAKFVQYGLLALVVLSPLPMASVHEWSILAIELTVLAMTGAYVLAGIKPAINARLEAKLKVPRSLFIALFAFIVLQIVPLPAFLVRLLSPGTYAFHKAFSPGFAGKGLLSLSVVPAHTFREGLELAVYVLAGFLVVRTVTRGREIRRLIAFLVAMGAFEAFYGLYELTTAHPRLLFFKKIYSLGSVTGTFVNRSHLAGYLEMIIPLAIGLLIARLDFLSLGGEGLKAKLIHMTGKGLVPNLLLFAAVIVMSLGVVFSQSRSGIFTLVLAFILFVEFIIIHFGRFGRRRWLRNFIWITFSLVTISALYIGIGSTIQRFAFDNLLREGRPLLWGNVIRIISAFPVFGSGLGTFVSVYPAYEKTAGPELLLTHAHNDYLEYMSELGVIGFALLLGAILFIGVRSFLSWRERRNPDVKGIALGGIISLIVILVHSLTDFNLQIPANMLLFSIVLALTFVTAFYRKS